MIKLGWEVRDKVSGFSGIAVSKTIFLNGCVRIGIAPKLDKDGKMQEERWFDEQQIEYLGNGVIAQEEIQANTGGPSTNSPPSALRS